MTEQELTLDWSSFETHFGTIPDFRESSYVRYPLIEIMFLVLCGVICDCEGWEEVADFGEDELDWLREYFAYTHGVPSHDTLNRVISAIDHKAFERAFSAWVGSLLSLSGLQINIDGKAVRGSRDSFEDKPAVHLVNAWCSAYRLSLGQVKTETKSNEITAIPELLQMLSLEGSIVSIDAMGCQKAIADQIVESGADYFLAVKDNQPSLLAGIEESFQRLPPSDTHQTIEKNRSRIETRKAEVLTDLTWVDTADQWTGLQSIVRIQTQRELLKSGKVEQHTRYYITAASPDAKMANGLARGHWAIENQLHWSLDVLFNEDASRKRIKNAAQNMALFRKMALNILRNESSNKSIPRKRKQASRNIIFRNKIFRKMEMR